MRRALLLAVGILTLALAAPTVANAHGRHHHGKHHHKHKRGHKADHAQLPAGGAGTVASFSDGVLTITLADGSSLSGAVGEGTEIGCVTVEPAPAPTATVAHHGDDRGDWRRHRCGGSEDCDTDDLVAGAVVAGAELRLGADGLAFTRIWLVKPDDDV